MSVWIESGGKRRRVDLPANAQDGGMLSCKIDGHAVDALVHTVQPGTLSLIVDGRQYHCILDGDAVVIGGRRYEFAVDDPRSLRGRRGAGEGAAGPRTVKASMPGRIVRILVNEGDEVAEHQGIIVIEAMKMQNELKSPKAGRIAKIAVAVDTTVSAGEALIVVE
ncbi:MAG TPA: biotin/lipoyl-containing protein [Edaphobacter sp.]|jgi:biotin carboxyl carrier protein